MISRKYGVLRYATIVAGVASGFLQIALYVRHVAPHNVAFVVMVTGYSIFLNLIDGGLSRPAYAHLRSLFLERADWKQDVLSLLCIYSVLGILLVCVFSVVVFGASMLAANTLSKTVVFLLGVNLAGNTCVNFFRNIFNAVDLYFGFEATELIRRIGNVASAYLLIADPSMLLTNLAQLAIVACVYVYVIRTLMKKADIRLGEIFTMNAGKLLEPVRKYWRDTRSYMVFMVSETVVYNAGYLFIPLFLGKEDMVLYGLWMRIYSGMALVMRAITDITIHPITRHYFRKEIAETRGYLLKTLAGSLLSVVLMLAVFASVQGRFMNLWVSGKYLLSSGLLLGMLLWLLGNAIQHVTGTFLLSIGNRFSELMRISIAVGAAILIVYPIVLSSSHSLNLVILWSAVVYIAGASVYAGMARRACA